MTVSKKVTSKLTRIGDKNLSLQDKMVLLRERYKREDLDLSETLGVTRVTLSRWVNGHVGEIKGEYRRKLLELSGGFLDETDLPTSTPVEYKPAAKPAAKPTPKPSVKAPAKPAPKLQDDDEFIV